MSRCIMCNIEIPEGIYVCPICERKINNPRYTFQIVFYDFMEEKVIGFAKTREEANIIINNFIERHNICIDATSRKEFFFIEEI